MVNVIKSQDFRMALLLLATILALSEKVVSGQSITSSLPAAFFTTGPGVNFVNGSVLQLFCTADSPNAAIAWEHGGAVLKSDPPHIRIRSNSDTSTVTSILTVDDFQTADNGAYQCRVGATAMATTQTLTAFFPVNSDDTLFIFRHPNERETNPGVHLNPPADSRSAVALGATIDPDGTSLPNTLLRCVAAHTNDVGQPLGTIVWTRNGEELTTGGRVTLTPLAFPPPPDANRYGADLRITNFMTSDAGIYQCIATDDRNTDSDVATSPPFRLDTDLAGDVVRLERTSHEVIQLTPPNKLVIEVKASGRYGSIIWTKDDLPLDVDSPSELPNFAEMFVRGVTTASDLGTYTVQLTTLNPTQTRQPESLLFQVVPPLPTSLFIQLRLTGSLNCLEWISDRIEAKQSSLRDTIAASIEEECQLQCDFSQSVIISDGFFRCFSSNAVTYRGTLHGTNTATASELATYLEQWSARGVDFPVQTLSLTVDSSCTVVIESLNDPECLPRFTEQSTLPATDTPATDTPATDTPATDTPATDNETTEAPSDITATIVGVVAGVIVVITLAVTIPIVLLVLRRASKVQLTAEPVQMRQYNPDDKYITASTCSAYGPTATRPPVCEDPSQYPAVPDYEDIKPDPPPPRVKSGGGPGQKGGGEEGKTGGGADDYETV